MQKNTVKTNKVKEIANKVFHITFVCLMVYLIIFFIGMFGFGYDIMHMEPVITVTVEEGDEEHLGGITFVDDEETEEENYEACKVIRTNVDND